MKLIMRWLLLSMLMWSAGGLRAASEGLSDPAWTSGVLENGIRYYIRPNAKPENRLELRLAVNAGSLQEDEDQQGLAHYLEHAAFNGTTHFEKDEMVKFLESLGVGFGPDLNAYTSFDETVYMLRLPTEDAETVEKGYLILSDWASEITASDEALADERGVIIEEWRGRRGAQARVRDQQFPVMFPGSKYANRMPIGKLEVLQNFEFERLREFYRDWYRPELMSVIAVGDLDVEETRRLIEKNFSGIVASGANPERVGLVHPSHAETMVGVFSDPELTASEVTLMWKMPPMPVLSQTDYQRSVKASLVVEMLNLRLAEIAQSADAPFLGGGAYRGGYTRGGDVFLLSAGVKNQPGAHVTAAQALLAETLRAKQHGFTAGELQRAKANQLRRLEMQVKEMESKESDAHAREMVRHALTGEWMPGIEAEFELHQKLFPMVTTQELQALLQSWIREDNRVIMAEGPSKENGDSYLPSEEELLAVYGQVEGMTLEPYSEGNLEGPLVAASPAGGQVVYKEVREDLGLHFWTLSNGVRVVLKPTDFKQDQILLNAWSPGGYNGYDNAKAAQARMASGAMAAMGLGDFSAVDLGKKLSGKLVSLSASITGTQDGLKGSASPEDLQTLLELVYLHFQEPRRDPEAFEAMRVRLRESVRNRLASPKARFRDMVDATMSSYHPRLRPMTLEDVETMDLEKILEIIGDRFSSAGDFTFLLTGNVDPETVEPLLATWLGGLPARDGEETSAYLDVSFPQEQLRRTMTAGVEPISEVHMVWYQDDADYTYETRHRIRSMADALRIRLREVLREELSGTYHTSVIPQVQHRPEPRITFRVVFGCEPSRVDEMIEATRRVVEEMQTELLAESYLQSVAETQRRRREVDLKENSFWDSVLSYYLWNDEDPGILLEFEDYVGRISAERIRDAARQAFAVKDQSVFILKPEPVQAPAEGEVRLGQLNISP